MRATTLKVDVSQVEELAAKIGQVDEAELGPLIVATLNKVVDKTYLMSRERIRLGMNVSDEYLQRMMEVRHATSNKPVAEIRAEYEGLGLSHFDAKQIPKAAVSPIRKLKGDPARGIPRGQKQGGVSVEVRRGARKQIGLPGVFIAPGIRDTAGNPFVFQRGGGRTRTGKDRLRRLFGPAAYQLFRWQIPTIEEPVTDDLVETLNAELDAWLAREFD